MRFADYRAIDAVNWSHLSAMRRSPLHYRHRMDTPRADTTRLGLGRAAHTAVLEPDRFLLDYCVFQGARRAGKTWDDFESAHSHLTILKLDEYETALAMRDAVRKHPVAAEYLAKGTPEYTITWTDPETGIACKGRADFLSISRPALIDLKTTGDVDSLKFSSTAARMGYHCQLAFYSDGLMYATGLRPPVVIVAVEASPPHDVAVFRFDEDSMQIGTDEYRGLLRSLKECQASGIWSGRYPEEQTLALPGWAYDAQGESDDLGLTIVGGP